MRKKEKRMDNKIKTVTVPDLHGKDDWKEINPDNYDKIIFLGDYVDGAYRKVSDISFSDGLNTKVFISEKHGRNNSEMIYNLSEIIEFKDKYPDKVELCVGNHDVPYIYLIKNRAFQSEVMCSGYRYRIENELARLFNDNIDKFKIAFQIEDVLWSHAGITQQAYDTYFKCKIGDNFDTIADELNRLFVLNEPDLFHVSHIREGRMPHGSILWADKSEWIVEKYKLPLKQIVGHSHVEDITFLYDEDVLRLTTEILPLKINTIFTDTLNAGTQFLEIEI